MGSRRRIATVLVATVTCALASAGEPAPPPTSSSPLLSLNTDGGGSGNSYAPVFSPDGTKIAFVSWAPTFGPTDTNDQPDIYVADLATGEISLVSVNQAGTDHGALGRD